MNQGNAAVSTSIEDRRRAKREAQLLESFRKNHKPAPGPVRRADYDLNRVDALRSVQALQLVRVGDVHRLQEPPRKPRDSVPA